MVVKDAGWAALAAFGFCLLCAFSIWGDVSGAALYRHRHGPAAQGGLQSNAAALGTLAKPGQP